MQCAPEMGHACTLNSIVCLPWPPPLSALRCSVAAACAWRANTRGEPEVLVELVGFEDTREGEHAGRAPCSRARRQQGYVRALLGTLGEALAGHHRGGRRGAHMAGATAAVGPRSSLLLPSRVPRSWLPPAPGVVHGGERRAECLQRVRPPARGASPGLQPLRLALEAPRRLQQLQAPLQRHSVGARRRRGRARGHLGWRATRC